MPRVEGRGLTALGAAPIAVLKRSVEMCGHLLDIWPAPAEKRAPNHFQHASLRQSRRARAATARRVASPR